MHSNLFEIFLFILNWILKIKWLAVTRMHNTKKQNPERTRAQHRHTVQKSKQTRSNIPGLSPINNLEGSFIWITAGSSVNNYRFIINQTADFDTLNDSSCWWWWMSCQNCKEVRDKKCQVCSDIQCVLQINQLLVKPYSL